MGAQNGGGSGSGSRRRALAGREYVLKRHSAARLVRDVDALYRELLAAKKAA